MLSTTILLSYLLPLSSLLPSSEMRHARPVPSSRISHQSQPRLLSNDSSTSSLYLPSTERITWQPLSVLRETQASVRGEEREINNEAVYPLEPLQDDVEWYYSAADEEELRQEQLLWNWLLLETSSGTGKARVAELFKDLLVVQAEQHQAMPVRSKQVLESPRSQISVGADSLIRSDL